MTSRLKLLASAVGLVGVATMAPAHAQTKPAPTAAAAAPGAAQFRMRCQSCHSVTPGAAAALGPNLAGVVGRKAAATTFRYSDALKRSGLTWTRPNLDRYIAAPTQVVPGTRMVIKVTNPTERAAIIDFLAARR
jgi:cytochrome c